MRKAGMSLAQSVPACNSHSYPGCVDPENAKTVGPKELKPTWQTDDWGRPNLNESMAGTSKMSLIQTQSIPACNSADFPDCVKDANTISPWKLNVD